MSSFNNIENNIKSELLEKLVEAIYQNSTAAVFFHTAMAEQIGLGATEEKTLFLLSGKGSMTAGEIAQETGLASASVTSLIDRLEKKGFVRRIHDQQDRRRVIVELNTTKFNELTGLFASLGDTFNGLLEGFNEEQLTTIINFLSRATQYTHRFLAQLKGENI